MAKNRCTWCGTDPLYMQYHDDEWGVPVWDDQTLFEFLILEGAQAGLSWITVLKKREAYRKLFSQFDANKVARYTDNKLEKHLQNPAIIRNRLKVYGARKNALAFLEVQADKGSFANYIWDFVDGAAIQNHFKNLSEVPAETDLAKKVSKDLKARGFRFVGPTIVYAFMEAVGMVNDHLVDCHRHDDCAALAKRP